MPTFKYTVANQQGKNLSGVVEAENMETAREELNKLGLSIINLEESQAEKQEDKKPRFIFEAIDKDSRSITGTVPANNREEAFRKLREEYDLTVTAIWPENASEEEIAKAKAESTEKLQEQLTAEDKAKEKVNTGLLQEKREEAFTRAKIETVLRKVNELLKNYDKYFDQDQKKAINIQINKVLRIKNSTNLEYILQSAEELLHTIEEQQDRLREKGLQDKQINLAIETSNLLGELKKSSRPKSLSADIITKISDWQAGHGPGRQNFFTAAIYKILNKIKEILSTPPEILALKDQIKSLNKQLWDFVILYFKEPTTEYKEKVKNSIKTVWKARKKAKADIKAIRQKIKAQKQELSQSKEKKITLLAEINTLSGFLLIGYLSYYFIAIYFTSKNFSIFQYMNIPKPLHIYETVYFKNILVTIFLLHSATALKINFFKNNIIANFILAPSFIILSTISILNF